MHCFTEEPLSNLKDFPLQGFNYNALFRVWDVCISAIRQSDFSFKAYLRPKPLQSLKQQLLDMVAMVQFQTTFQSTVRTSSIINTLHTTTSYLRQQGQVTQDIGASHVIHGEENVRILDITSTPSQENVQSTTSR